MKKEAVKIYMEYTFAKEQMVSRHRKVKRHKSFTPHFHDTHELYYMAKGRTTYFIDNELYSVEQGNFVFIPMGSVHSTDYENCERSERVLVCFGDDIFGQKGGSVREELLTMRVIRLPDTQIPMAEEILYKIETEYGQKEKNREFLLDVYIQELLIFLCRHHCEKKVGIRESDKIIYDVSEYIRNNFAQEIALEGLSRRFAVNKSYLSRKFKQVTGIGINEYISFVRISNGERLLRESRLTVTEVARQCGFNDSNYFAAVFKKIKGVTPLKYRRQGDWGKYV